MRRTTAFIAVSLLATAASHGQDCGQPPVDLPTVPDGATVERDEIVAARNAVIAYSEKVDDYLNCMDARVSQLSPYLSKDARERIAEDIAEIANKRTEVQVAINKAIREYRRRQDDDGDAG